MSTAVQAQREADADGALEALNCQSCGLLLDMPVPEWCSTPASHHAAPTPDEVRQSIQIHVVEQPPVQFVPVTRPCPRCGGGTR